MPTERITRLLQDKAPQKPTFELEAWDKPPTSIRRYVAERILLLGVILALYFMWVGHWLVGAGAFVGIVVYLYLMRLKPNRLTVTVGPQSLLIGERVYPWENLLSFWICERDGFYIVYFETTEKFPNFVGVVVSDFVDARALALALAEYIPYKKLTKQDFWQKFTYGRYIYPHEIEGLVVK